MGKYSNFDEFDRAGKQKFKKRRRMEEDDEFSPKKRKPKFNRTKRR
jgi:hypothetical protein